MEVSGLEPPTSTLRKKNHVTRRPWCREMPSGCRTRHQIVRAATRLTTAPRRTELSPHRPTPSRVEPIATRFNSASKGVDSSSSSGTDTKALRLASGNSTGVLPTSASDPRNTSASSAVPAKDRVGAYGADSSSCMPPNRSLSGADATRDNFEMQDRVSRGGSSGGLGSCRSTRVDPRRHASYVR